MAVYLIIIWNFVSICFLSDLNLSLWWTWLRLIYSRLKGRRNLRNWNFDLKMKNSVSDRSFYIESSDDEDLEKEIDNDDGNDSDSSGSSVDNRNHNQPSSYNTAAWPQSYRFTFSSSQLFPSSFFWQKLISG